MERGTYRNQPWVTEDGLPITYNILKEITSVGINLELSRVGLQLLWQGYGGMTTCDVMSSQKFDAS